jgi:hypothetical protein
MRQILICTGLIVAVMGLGACSSMPKSQPTKDLETAPQYTQEEKDAMTEEERIALYNESMSQKKNKVVCRREKPLGSHMTKTVCRTQEEIELDRELARESLIESGRGERPQGPGN